MWVEVFPHDLGPIPPAIDITPTEPKPYVLRIVVGQRVDLFLARFLCSVLLIPLNAHPLNAHPLIALSQNVALHQIWNTFDVLADDKSIHGEEMSDIYVRCFFRGLEKKRKKTDTHYRSLNGEGNFNWRMNFEFDYLPTEEKLVVRKKRSLISFGDKEEQKLPPTLALQVWDNDLFSANDFIGNMDLDLTKIPRPFRFPKDCKPYDQIPKSEVGRRASAAGAGEGQNSGRRSPDCFVLFLVPPSASTTIFSSAGECAASFPARQTAGPPR